MFMMLREILTRLSAEFKERELIVTKLTQGPKLYIPSTLNIDLILWHTQLNVCA